MKFFYYAFFFLALVSVLAFVLHCRQSVYFANTKEIKIGNAEINAEIADTPLKRAKGLSGRDGLPEKSGMLFIFENSGYHYFWMKDMLIPLDFIWINNSRVIDTKENVKPEDYQPPKTLASQDEVNMVLEVNAGFVQKENIKIGDGIEF